MTPHLDGKQIVESWRIQSKKVPSEVVGGRSELNISSTIYSVRLRSSINLASNDAHSSSARRHDSNIPSASSSSSARINSPSVNSTLSRRVRIKSSAFDDATHRFSAASFACRADISTFAARGGGGPRRGGGRGSGTLDDCTWRRGTTSTPPRGSGPARCGPYYYGGYIYPLVWRGRRRYPLHFCSAFCRPSASVVGVDSCVIFFFRARA